MKNKHRLLGLVSLTLVLSSGCSSSSEKGSHESTRFITQVVDSISFERLSEVKLLDYNDKTRELLVSDEQTREVFILNEKGEIVSSFKPHVDGPNYVENNNFGWTFLGDNELVAYGRVYFHRLSKEGERLQRMEYPVKPRGWAWLDHDPQMLESTNKSLLAMIPGVYGGIRRSKVAQDTSSIMFLMDFKTLNFKSVLRKPAESIYRLDNSYYGDGIPLFSKLNESTLAVTYAADTSLFIYDLTKDEYFGRISIPAEYHAKVIPVSFDSNDSPKEESVNTRLFSTGEQIILEHMGQIPEEVWKQIMQVENWPESPEMDNAIRQYVDRKYSIYSQDKYLGELDWTVGEGFINTVNTESGFIWVQRSYKDERDYRTFLKVKIVPAEE